MNFCDYRIIAQEVVLRCDDQSLQRFTRRLHKLQDPDEVGGVFFDYRFAQALDKYDRLPDIKAKETARELIKKLAALWINRSVIENSGTKIFLEQAMREIDKILRVDRD